MSTSLLILAFYLIMVITLIVCLSGLVLFNDQVHPQKTNPDFKKEADQQKDC